MTSLAFSGLLRDDIDISIFPVHPDNHDIPWRHGWRLHPTKNRQTRQQTPPGLRREKRRRLLLRTNHGIMELEATTALGNFHTLLPALKPTVGRATGNEREQVGLNATRSWPGRPNGSWQGTSRSHVFGAALEYRRLSKCTWNLLRRASTTSGLPGLQRLVNCGYPHYQQARAEATVSSVTA
jgi:hypothetical protein